MRCGRHHLVQGTPYGADPVASPSSVGPSQRAQRGGPSRWLKVRANPMGNHASVMRPDKSRYGGASLPLAGVYGSPVDRML